MTVRRFVLVKVTTDRHEASRGLFATAELLVRLGQLLFTSEINVFFQKILARETRGQSNLTKSASRGVHSPVRGHPRGSKVVPLNSWGRVSY